MKKKEVLTISFAAFIDEYGPVKLAEKLEITRQTIYKWRKLENSPHPKTALAIIHLSGGLMTWEKIYLPFALKK